MSAAKDPTPVEARRHVALSGCHNFRDLGGYPTTDGRRTRWGRLFRADGLSALTAEDQVLITGLGVTTVIDLRTDLEVDNRVSIPLADENVTYHHLALTDTLPGEEQAPDWGDPAFVMGRYRGMLAEGAHSVAEAIRILAKPANLPAVFHCSVGKDRTGVLAAVILGMLGVPDEVIVEDYTLSLPAMVRLLEMFRREYPDSSEIVERYAPVILAVDPATMAGFLAGVRADYGSFSALAEQLGVASEREDLARELLEPA
jgi:protein-tyrosine phosphatase